MTPNPSYREIPLTKGKVALVSAHRYEYLRQFRWYAFHASGKWYASRVEKVGSGKRRTILMHREILGILGESIPCDHINGNGLDNRDDNLRRCSASENTINRYSSDHRGVRRDGGSWQARIRVQNHHYHIGHFSTEHDAKIAYAVAAKILHGQFRHLSVLEPEQVSAAAHLDATLEGEGRLRISPTS